MPELEVRRADGRVERLPLNRMHPASIGKHASSDVCVDHEDVHILHCRVSWNKRAYEVTAATMHGIDVNGASVQNTLLSEGDVLRVGDAEIVYLADEKSGQQRPPPAPPTSSPPSEARSERSKARSKREAKPERVLRRIKAPDQTERQPAPDDDEHDWEPSAKTATNPLRPAAGRLGRLRGMLRSRQVRPGEQDVLRSPLVITLGWGALLLLLVAATFWFLIGRETSERLYDGAVAEMNQGKYTQAIKLFEEFLEDYPRHRLSAPARIGLGKSKIEREIAGGTPAWDRGLERLRDFINQQRDRSDFDKLQPDLRKYAEQIALGAADSAQTGNDRELLELSQQAVQLVTRYGKPGEDLDLLVDRIRDKQAAALASIRRRETFDAGLAEMQQAIETEQPMEALAARDRLLERYREFADDRRIRAAVAEALEVEKSLARRGEPARDAELPSAEPPARAPLTLAAHARTRTDQESLGRLTFTVAADCCYAVDTVTGEPIWRRVIGLDAPFYPQLVETQQPGLLLYDTTRGELVLLQQETGAPVWRQSLPNDVRGAPLVREGQIYLVVGRDLYRLDVETGRITTRLTFSQKLVGPPVALADGAHLVVPGRAAVLYTVSLRPPECRVVSYLGYSAGAIESPLLAMDRLLLLCENDRLDSCRLRVLDASDPGKPLKEVAGARIDGHVRDLPIMRGPQLFVPSSGERVAAFTVADDKGIRSLTPVASYQVRGGYGGPLYLAAGPDNQLWMAGSALRRFELSTDSIRPDPKQTAVGLAAQPPQPHGQDFFVARKTPFSNAVTLTRVDRERMVSPWKVVLGAAVIATAPASGGGLIAVSEMGGVFRLTSSNLAAEGFYIKPTLELELPESLRTPLSAKRLEDGRIAVSCGNPVPKLWLINAVGQIDREVALEAPLQTDPMLLKGGLVLPVPGRLRYHSLTARTTPVNDLIVPIGPEQTHRWRHVARGGDGDLLALDADGRLSRIQLRGGETPHLAEVAKFELPDAVDMPFAVAEGRVFIADAAGRLRVYDVRTFEPLAETDLNGPATGPVYLVNPYVFVESGGRRVSAFAVDDGERVWSIDAEKLALASEPLVENESVYLASRSGVIRVVDAASGELRQTGELAQPLSGGVVQVGTMPAALTIDGSVVSIEGILEASNEREDQTVTHDGAEK